MSRNVALIASALWFWACFPGPLQQDEAETSEQGDTSPHDSRDSETELDEVLAEVVDGEGQDTLVSDDVTFDDVLDDAHDVAVDATAADASDAAVDASAIEADASPTCIASGDESCNGLDDDCDGSTDEDFVDTDSDFAADCVDDDDDGDFLSDEVDPSPLEAYLRDCSDPALEGSVLGCRFWSVDTPTYFLEGIDSPFSQAPVRLVLVNPGPFMATVVGANIGSVVVDALSTYELEIPSASASVNGVSSDGVFTLSSDVPITVTQLNAGTAGRYPEGTVLLPAQSLGTHYIVASETGFSLPGLAAYAYFVVVATDDDTVLELRPTTRVDSGPDLDGVEVGASGTVALAANQALTVFATYGPNGPDPSGTQVSSNRPIAVIAGHEAALSSNGSSSVGRIESSLLPDAFTAAEYALVPSKTHGPDTPDTWRVLAVDDDVVLESDPPRVELQLKRLAKRGDWMEFVSSDATLLSSATGARFVVYQFINGDSVSNPDSPRHPAMHLVPPTLRFAPSQHVHAFAGFSSALAMIRRAGSAVFIDGDAVASTFVPIGSSGWEYSWVDIDPGTHVVRGSTGVGVAVYGHATAASYAVWGGLAPP